MSDNHHVIVSGSQASCGIGELSRLSSDPEKILYALANSLYHPSRGQPYTFVMWSDTPDSNGFKFDQYVQSLGLNNNRDQWSTGWAENAKTSNDIKVWVWEIPHKELKEWYIKARIAKASKV